MKTASNPKPLIVGIGGTTRAGSTTEKALAWLAKDIERRGGEVVLFAGPRIEVPMYDAGQTKRPASVQEIIDALRRCDGVVLASPGYHGGFSGMLKNVLDYAQDLAADSRPFLRGRAVGCIAGAYGWQAIGTTLMSLRSVVHALNGWPTPSGVSILSTSQIFDEAGECVVQDVRESLSQMGSELLEFAEMRRRLVGQ